MNRKQMLLLWNQPLKYCPDTMVSYLWRSKDIQLRDIWFSSSVIRSQKREGPQHTYHWWNSQLKGRTYFNVFMSNYTNRHVTFNKGEHVGHLELPTEDMKQLSKDSEALIAHSLTTKRMMAEEEELDTLTTRPQVEEKYPNRIWKTC